MTYYLSAAYAKHLLSRLSIYLDVCVQTLVTVGNNKRARLSVSIHIYEWLLIYCDGLEQAFD